MPYPLTGDADELVGAAPLLATHELLSLAGRGSSVARDQLMARYLPRLRRWASGQLPVSARSLFDTSDVVQEILLRVLEGLDRFEVRGPGGFEAYVRTAIRNRIRDQVEWAGRRSGTEGIADALPDRSPSPLESAIGADLLERYERAWSRLTEEEQQLLHLRLELDFDYQEIAEMTDRPSRDAARMAVRRALAGLEEAMGYDW